MERKDLHRAEQDAKIRHLTEDESAQVAGGHSHARSTVFMARRPGGGMSSYRCDQCQVDLPDAGSYFEHMRMVHGQ